MKKGHTLVFTLGKARIREVFRRIGEEMSTYPSKFALTTAYTRRCARAGFEANRESSPSLQLQSTFVEGNEVDRASQLSIFSDGETIRSPRTTDADSSTRALVSEGRSRINQATLVVPGGETVRLDSLSMAEGGWSIDEVKSGLSVKGKYVFDALISAEVAVRAGLEVANLTMIHLNSSWRLGDPQGDLFVSADITEALQDEEAIALLREYRDSVGGTTPPVPTLGPGCWKGQGGDSTGKCPYFSGCFGETPNPITELSRLGDQRISMLSESGVVDIRDIPEGFDLTPGQRARVDFVFNGQEHVNRDSLADSLDGISLPVRHLDFESVSFAIPIHDGVAPWGQVVTQYSIHTETEGGLAHAEHLSGIEGDGRRELAESLIRDLGSQGSIIVWNASFERARIRELAGLFQDLSEPLEAIERRLFDLLPVVRRDVLHPDFHGKTSLKVVAPVLSPGFGYQDLDIAGGGDAQGAMNLMMRGRVDEGDVPEMRERLLRYCERDTEATVRILQALREMVLH